jgi:hypothetical protein
MVLPFLKRPVSWHLQEAPADPYMLSMAFRAVFQNLPELRGLLAAALAGITARRRLRRGIGGSDNGDRRRDAGFRKLSRKRSSAAGAISRLQIWPHRA